MNATSSRLSERREESDRRQLAKLRIELGLISDYLERPDVLEVLRNPDGSVWIDRLGVGMEPVDQMDDDQAERIIRTVASLKDREVNEERPVLECELPWSGERFTGLKPPIVSGPTLSIRKRALKVMDLQDYVTEGRMTPSARLILEQAVTERANILVAGPTSSGKTTICNSLIRVTAQKRPDDRLVSIEDALELQFSQPNVVPMRTSDFVNQRALLKAAMRLRPDSIMVGEVRDGAALDLLKAWNTGHPGGCTTLHADSAADALSRLEMLVAEAPGAPPPTMIGQLVGRAVNLVVFMAKGRRVEEIVRIGGHNGQYILEQLGN